MGDMADWLTEQGMDEALTHRMGECEGFCPYCEAEERKKRKPKKRHAPVEARKEDA